MGARLQRLFGRQSGVNFVAVRRVEGQGFLDLHERQGIFGSDLRWREAPCLGCYH